MERTGKGIVTRKSLLILLLSFLLVLGYMALDKNILLALVQWKEVLPEASSHKWEVLSKFYGYAASNIFDKGYTREVGPEFHKRLSVYLQEMPLEKGHFVLANNSSKNILKIALPKGFKHGTLSLKTNAKTGYSIGVSYDLNKWEFYDYPGYAVQSVYIVDLEKRNLADRTAYLKFVPSRNDSLSIYFDVFQYTSDLLSDVGDYKGMLFISDIEIDYDGKVITQPGVLYENKKN